ncbi:MAG: hypothetical protein ACFCVE_00890 [Phycisphaerae bacterium]
MDVAPAKLYRVVNDTEAEADLLDEAKERSWTQRAEHALLLLEDGRRVIISGGFTGIELMLDAEHRPVLQMDEGPIRIRRLVWHVHPMVTGPSDADMLVLRVIGQRNSLLYEIGGERSGTEFYDRKRS